MGRVKPMGVMGEANREGMEVANREWDEEASSKWVERPIRMMR